MKAPVQKFNSQKTKTLVTLSMLTAIAFLCVALIRIPVVSFLKYEPKDCIIAISAFLYGPGAGAAISIVVSFIEMLTISDTGIIGFFMNILQSLLFILPAVLIYRNKKNLKNAVFGLILGTLCMTGGMILWNYIVTPFYMDIPREQVIPMLIPVFLTFNLFKGGLNSAITIFLYKRAAMILRKIGALNPSSQTPSQKVDKTGNIIVAVVSAAVIITLIFVLLAWTGKI